MLVKHDYKVFVGDVPFSVYLDNNVAPSPLLNPSCFYQHACETTRDVYSNNMDFVRFYKPENVMVVRNTDRGEQKIKCLTECPGFDKWKDEFDSGEMFSVFGNEWVI